MYRLVLFQNYTQGSITVKITIRTSQLDVLDWVGELQVIGCLND